MYLYPYFVAEHHVQNLSGHMYRSTDMLTSRPSGLGGCISDGVRVCLGFCSTKQANLALSG